MTERKRKEIEKIVLDAFIEMRNAETRKLEAAKCCESRMMTAQEFAVLEINNMSKEDLFKKVVSNLPLVYCKEYTTEFLTYKEWKDSITRENLLNANKLTEREYSFFDELSLSDIKAYFAIQIENEYRNQLNATKALHCSIIKKHYEVKAEKKPTTTVKKGNK